MTLGHSYTMLMPLLERLSEPYVMCPRNSQKVVLWAVVAAVWTALVGASTCFARDDFQSWNTLELSKQVGTAWELFFLPEIRLRDDAGELFYHEYRQGIRWKHFKHLQLGLNYLFARNESSGKPREEHTGELDVTPKVTLGSLSVSVRGRLALRTIQGSSGEQEWQIRFMPKLSYPIWIAQHHIALYTAEDLFYDYTRDAWNQNRSFLGVTIPLPSEKGIELSADLYYMLQHQLGTRHDWSSNHILGTKLSVKF